MAIAKRASVNDIKYKILVWGDPGSRKTRFGLSTPKPIVVDLENSTTHYAAEFEFLRAKVDQSTKAKSQVKGSAVIDISNATKLTTAIINEIVAGEYKGEAETLVVDPITDLLDNIESILANTYETTVIKKKVVELSALDRTKWFAYRRDNTRRILDQMINLDCNIVWVVRSKNVWDKGADGRMQPVGKTMDCLDILEFLTDVVIEMKKDGDRFYSIVSKSRARTIKEGVYEDLTTFNQLLEMSKSKKSKTAKQIGDEKVSNVKENVKHISNVDTKEKQPAPAKAV